MRRREFVLAGAALLSATTARSQTSRGLTARVGLLQFGEATQDRARYYGGFKAGLSALGWHEGSNLALTPLFAQGRTDRLSELASQLTAELPDVIVAAGGISTVRALQAATRTIPTVMIGMAVDPVETGLVQSLSRPGGNLTGTVSLGPPLNAKRLELLKEVVPTVRRVGVVFNPAIWSIEHLQSPAAVLQITIIPVPIRAVDELAGIPDRGGAKLDALALLTDPAILESNLQSTLGLLSRAGLPTVFPWRSYVVAGGLMSYAASLDDLYRRAAVTVARILKGEHPSQLPIEQPDRFELAINVRTARALGLTFPASVLLRAEEVIE